VQEQLLEQLIGVGLADMWTGLAELIRPVPSTTAEARADDVATA